MDHPIDASQFLKNECEGDYHAEFEVHGEVYVSIKASSLEEAQAKAKAMLDDENFGHELDSVHEIEAGRIRKDPTMFLVLRDGKNMQVSHLKAGDMPRAADERGF